MSARRTPSLRDAVLPVCQMLEQRTFLCDAHILAQLPEPPQWSEEREALARSEVGRGGGTIIDWTNRNQTSDNFANTFGTSAETMRNIVDAALFAWQRVITDWNRSDSSVSLQVTINVLAPGTNFGGAAAPGNAPSDGKPRTGSVTLGGGSNTPDPNDVNNWFADPDPYDNAEFLGNIINAYTSETSVGGLDFFSLVTIELAHVLGIISDPNNAGGGFENYRLENFVTNTGVPDIAQGGGNGTYRVFNGATIDHVMTSFNSGSAGVNSWGNVIHTTGPTADVTFNGLNYRGSVDPGNALYGPQRYLPSFVDAHILADAYGYSIAEPMTFGTFHAVIDETSGRLTVRGGGGVSNDDIHIAFINGNTIRVSVDVGADVPGTGALAGAGNLPAFVTDFTAIFINEILVDGGDGDDLITIESLPFFADATVRGGSGNDFIQFAPGTANLDTIAAPITLDSGPGTSDFLRFHDYNSPGSHAYNITSTGMTRAGSGGRTLANVEIREIYGADGNNPFNVAGSPAGTLWKLAGHLGNDTFNIGTVDGNADFVDGAIEAFGEEGTDPLSYNDVTAIGTHTYSVGSTSILRSGNGGVTIDGIESVKVDASSGNDTIVYNNTRFEPIPVILNGNGGTDSITTNITQQISGAVVQNFLHVDGGASTDTFVVNNSVPNASFLGPVFESDNIFTAVSGIFEFTTCEAMTWNVLTNEADNLFVRSVAAGTTLTLNGGVNNEFFEIGGRPIFFGTVTMDPILGPVVLNGNAGTDTVNFADHNNAAANTYTLNGTSFTRSGIGTTTFATTEVVSINSGTAADTINIVNDAGLPVTVDGREGLDVINVNSDGVGTATARFDFTQDLAALNISAGGTAILNGLGTTVIDTDSLSIAATGKLDLNQNDLIVDYSGATQLAAIRALINSGRAGGAWTGNGITSTAAKNANPKNTTLGVLEASEFKTIYGASAPFAGRTIDTTAILVKYTYYGDADFNGTVNFDDYGRTDAGFNFGRTGWLNGDFDGNGTVNFDDYSLIDLAFNTQVGTL